VYEQLKTAYQRYRCSSSPDHVRYADEQVMSTYQVFLLLTHEHSPHVYLYTKQPASISVIIGGSSKVAASIITYPYQLIKSKMQQTDLMDSSSSGNTRIARYAGTWDCVMQIWRYIA